MNSVPSFSRESLCGKPVGQNGVLTPSLRRKSSCEKPIGTDPKETGIDPKEDRISLKETRVDLNKKLKAGMDPRGQDRPELEFKRRDGPEGPG
ncbi:hypothetical protein CDL15_Pgr008268 [Punica granatum]|uniref:Uncharacterized protein n=1 Tax=Punica granatum TaxID=22663 RepID=A0A218XW42_PUNGR|nr:hypothetical protein CDL15_Pgr008268 [Punica granatum]